MFQCQFLQKCEGDPKSKVTQTFFEKTSNDTVMIVQWNLGYQTTLISNKSVPEHKTKTKNGLVPEQANWQPGT
jgi:hypothetical protein